MGALIARLAAVLKAKQVEITALMGLSQFLGPIIQNVIDLVMSGEAIAQVLTDGVNAAISEALTPHGLSLVFTDITNKDAIRGDLYAFAINLIAVKIGADFSDVDFQTVTKDDILLRLSRVVRDRINLEAGAQLGDLWPVDVARKSIEDEVVREIVEHLGGQMPATGEGGA